LKQQNEFCGVVFKGEVKGNLLPGFRAVQRNCFVSAQSEVLFDGYREKNDGTWCEAQILDDQIVLSRDRIGGRWIYYFENDEVFCFANTIKQLLALDFVPFAVSSTGAFEFLFLGKAGDMIEGITSLPANHDLAINLRTFRKTLEERKVDEEVFEIDNEEEASKAVREAIIEGVSKVAGRGNKLGSLLSGGIDSSVIACALALKGEHLSLPFISALSERDHLNELDYAETVIAQLKIPIWHQVLAQNIDKEIEKLHLAMEFPTTSLGSFLQYEMMRFCKHQGIEEVLDGTGADALYAGHNYYNAIYWNELVRKGRLLRATKAALASGVAKNNLKYYWKNLFKYYYIPRFSIPAKLRFYLRNNELLKGLNPEFIREHYEDLATKPKVSLKNLNRYLANDFFGGGVEDLLRFNDRIGKFFGVMNRSIFTEFPSIYTYALHIAPRLKFKDGYAKYILRNAFADCLPAKVLQRKDKMGLVAPNNYWMKKHKSLFLSYFTEDLEMFFDVQKMKNLLDKAIDEAPAQENYKIFRFISFAIWYKVMKK
jgi:asparagine synthase (glutamine-hydrolysing)